MTVIAVALLAIGALFGVRLVEVCAVGARAAHVQAAADAAALAGVWGEDLARRVATLNHAELVDFSMRDGVVSVVVLLDGVSRAASAA